MAGNRAIFDRALEGSRAAVQRGAWPEALREALRAAHEFPEDLDARSAVAVALYHNQKYAQAAQLLEDLRKRRGPDPFTLNYLARAYTDANEPAKAVAVLLELGEQSFRQRRTLDAENAFGEAVRLAPDDERARLRLAEFFADTGDNVRAAEQCVVIARARYTAGDRPGAEEAINEAIELDPANRAARALQAEWKAGAAPQPDVPPPGTGQAGLPADPQKEIDQLVARAVQQRASGENEAALQTYTQAFKLGADRPDIHYGFGLLLQERGEHERAIDAFRRASTNDDYAVSAQYGMGEALRALGRLSEAAAAFENALRLVDPQSVGRAEVDDLIAMYQSAAECYAELGELSRAASLYGTLAGFLQGKRWGREMAGQFRTRAREMTERAMVAKLRRIGTSTLPVDPVGVSSQPSEAPQPALARTWGAPPSMTDFLEGIFGDGAAARPQPSEAADPFAALDLPEVDQAIVAPLTELPKEGISSRSVRFIDASSRFSEQGLLRAAMDACLEVIRNDPDYLPIHLRLGELYEREGAVESAVAKYRTLINTYDVREQPIEAIDAYYRLIELAPDSLSERTQLAALLRQAGRLTEAVDQSLVVANTLFRNGQTNRALDEFRSLLAWAPPLAAIHKEYGLALLKLERWKAALDEFRRAAQLDPDDPVALAQVNVTLAILGENERAIWDSFATLLEKLRADMRHSAAVQSEYRTALLIVDTPRLHYLLGLTQQASDLHASAILSFQYAQSLLAAEEFPPFSPILVHQALAESYMAEGQSKEAIDELEIVRSLLDEQPAGDFPAHHFARPLSPSQIERRIAMALVAADQCDRAIEALHRALELDPNDVSAYAQLGAIYFMEGHLELALEQLERVATAYEEQQQFDRAIATLEQAVNLAPDAIPMRARLAHLLLRRGNLDRGIHELDEVAQLQRDAGQIEDAVTSMRHVAEVYWMLGKHNEVYRVYDAILAIAPEDCEARQQLVNLYILSGRPDAAGAELRQIARLCVDEQDTESAIALLHQITVLDPNDGVALEQLGALLTRAGDHDQALRVYKRLSRLRPGDERVAVLQSEAEHALAIESQQPARPAGTENIALAELGGGTADASPS